MYGEYKFGFAPPSLSCSTAATARIDFLDGSLVERRRMLLWRHERIRGGKCSRVIGTVSRFYEHGNRRRGMLT